MTEENAKSISIISLSGEVLARVDGIVPPKQTAAALRDLVAPKLRFSSFWFVAADNRSRAQMAGSDDESYYLYNLHLRHEKEKTTPISDLLLPADNLSVMIVEDRVPVEILSESRRHLGSVRVHPSVSAAALRIRIAREIKIRFPFCFTAIDTRDSEQTTSLRKMLPPTGSVSVTIAECAAVAHILTENGCCLMSLDGISPSQSVAGLRRRIAVQINSPFRFPALDNRCCARDGEKQEEQKIEREPVVVDEEATLVRKLLPPLWVKDAEHSIEIFVFIAPANSPAHEAVVAQRLQLGVARSVESNPSRSRMSFTALPEGMDASVLLTTRDHLGQTLLHELAAAGLHEQLDRLLTAFSAAERVVIVDVPDREWRTPLWHAASKGHTATVSVLLDAFADPLTRAAFTMPSPHRINFTYSYRDGCTWHKQWTFEDAAGICPLAAAVQHAMVRRTTMLRRKMPATAAAAEDAEDRRLELLGLSRMILDMVAFSTRQQEEDTGTNTRFPFDCEHWLFSSGVVPSLHELAFDGDLTGIKTLYNFLQENFRVDGVFEKWVLKRDFSDASAVCAAARGGHVECVKYLVEECDLSATATDFLGNTALHHAAEGGHIDVATYLLEWSRPGAALAVPAAPIATKISSVNSSNFTPLHLALMRGRTQCVELLLTRMLQESKNLQKSDLLFVEDVLVRGDLSGESIVTLCAARGYAGALNKIIDICGDAQVVSRVLRRRPLVVSSSPFGQRFAHKQQKHSRTLAPSPLMACFAGLRLRPFGLSADDDASIIVLSDRKRSEVESKLECAALILDRAYNNHPNHHHHHQQQEEENDDDNNNSADDDDDDDDATFRLAELINLIDIAVSPALANVSSSLSGLASRVVKSLVQLLVRCHAADGVVQLKRHFSWLLSKSIARLSERQLDPLAWLGARISTISESLNEIPDFARKIVLFTPSALIGANQAWHFAICGSAKMALDSPALVEKLVLPRKPGSDDEIPDADDEYFLERYFFDDDYIMIGSGSCFEFVFDVPSSLRRRHRHPRGGGRGACKLEIIVENMILLRRAGKLENGAFCHMLTRAAMLSRRDICERILAACDGDAGSVTRDLYKLGPDPSLHRISQSVVALRHLLLTCSGTRIQNFYRFASGIRWFAEQRNYVPVATAEQAAIVIAVFRTTPRCTSSSCCPATMSLINGIIAASKLPGDGTVFAKACGAGLTEVTRTFAKLCSEFHEVLEYCAPTTTTTGTITTDYDSDADANNEDGDDDDDENWTPSFANPLRLAIERGAVDIVRDAFDGTWPAELISRLKNDENAPLLLSPRAVTRGLLKSSFELAPLLRHVNNIDWAAERRLDSSPGVCASVAPTRCRCTNNYPTLGRFSPLLGVDSPIVVQLANHEALITDSPLDAAVLYSTSDVVAKLLSRPSMAEGLKREHTRSALVRYKMVERQHIAIDPRHNHPRRYEHMFLLSSSFSSLFQSPLLLALFMLPRAPDIHHRNRLEKIVTVLTDFHLQLLDADSILLFSHCVPAMIHQGLFSLVQHVLHSSWAIDLDGYILGTGALLREVVLHPALATVLPSPHHQIYRYRHPLFAAIANPLTSDDFFEQLVRHTPDGIVANLTTALASGETALGLAISTWRQNQGRFAMALLHVKPDLLDIPCYVASEATKQRRGHSLPPRVLPLEHAIAHGCESVARKCLDLMASGGRCLDGDGDRRDKLLLLACSKGLSVDFVQNQLILMMNVTAANAAAIKDTTVKDTTVKDTTGKDTTGEDTTGNGWTSTMIAAVSGNDALATFLATNNSDADVLVDGNMLSCFRPCGNLLEPRDAGESESAREERSRAVAVATSPSLMSCAIWGGCENLARWILSTITAGMEGNTITELKDKLRRELELSEAMGRIGISRLIYAAIHNSETPFSSKSFVGWFRHAMTSIEHPELHCCDFPFYAGDGFASIFDRGHQFTHDTPRLVLLHLLWGDFHVARSLLHVVGIDVLLEETPSIIGYPHRGLIFKRKFQRHNHHTYTQTTVGGNRRKAPHPITISAFPKTAVVPVGVLLELIRWERDASLMMRHGAVTSNSSNLQTPSRFFFFDMFMDCYHKAVRQGARSIAQSALAEAAAASPDSFQSCFKASVADWLFDIVLGCRHSALLASLISTLAEFAANMNLSTQLARAALHITRQYAPERRKHLSISVMEALMLTPLELALALGCPEAVMRLMATAEHEEAAEIRNITLSKEVIRMSCTNPSIRALLFDVFNIRSVAFPSWPYITGGDRLLFADVRLIGIRRLLGNPFVNSCVNTVFTVNREAALIRSLVVKPLGTLRVPDEEDLLTEPELVGLFVEKELSDLERNALLETSLAQALIKPLRYQDGDKAKQENMEYTYRERGVWTL